MFGEAFDDETKRMIWKKWEKYYLERNHRRMPATTAHQQIKKLLAYTAKDMAQIIDFSIERGYQGLFFEKALPATQAVTLPVRKDVTGI